MEVYWLWLSLIKGIGPITAKKLLLHYKDPYCIYNANKDELDDIGILSKKQFGELINSKSLKNAQDIVNECKKREIKVITYDDELYKEKAKLCFKSPIVLFYKGTIVKENLGVGIVGARRCSEYGKRVAVEMAEYLTPNQLVDNKNNVHTNINQHIDSYNRSPLQNQILSLLKDKPQNLEEILFIIKEKKEIIIETLSIMEVEGMIEWSPRGVRILY